MGFAFGDACVPLSGYPIRILPASGVMQVAAYECLNVEVRAAVGMMGERQSWNRKPVFDRLREVEGQRPPEEFFPVLAKAILVHGAGWHDANAHLQGHFGAPGRESGDWKKQRVSPLIGYGRVQETDLCLSDYHRATVLGWGTIEAEQILEFDLPLPPSLSGIRGRKRFTVTLAWFSPINPRHRKYRVAKLAITLPESPKDVVAGPRRDTEHHQVCRGTVQHEIYEGTAPRGIAEASLPIQVSCSANAGDLPLSDSGSW